jgi:hypothetical protein
MTLSSSLFCNSGAAETRLLMMRLHYHVFGRLVFDGDSVYGKVTDMSINLPKGSDGLSLMILVRLDHSIRLWYPTLMNSQKV